MTNDDLVLEIKNLKTHFFTDEGIVKAVDGVDLSLYRNKTLCVVGESGCGKSVTAYSILKVVSRPGRVVSGEILLHHQNSASSSQPQTEIIDLAALNLNSPELRAVRGNEVAMIFQEPMTALSPVHTIGNQIIETIQLHNQVSEKEARQRAVELLRKVGIPNPETRLDAYTFELSGGMRQRAMVAIALSCNPKILIADEPTTALDVTTQALMLDLMMDLQKDYGMAMMFITHDLGVVAEIADDVAVMYLGKVVEYGSVAEIFHDPKHPYTRALLHSIPKLEFEARQRLDTIRGMVPHPFARPAGCPFYPRCDHFIEGVCDQSEPERIFLGERREVRCHLYGLSQPSKMDSLPNKGGGK